MEPSLRRRPAVVLRPPTAIFCGAPLEGEECEFEYDEYRPGRVQILPIPEDYPPPSRQKSAAPRKQRSNGCGARVHSAVYMCTMPRRNSSQCWYEYGYGINGNGNGSRDEERGVAPTVVPLETHYFPVEMARELNIRDDSYEIDLDADGVECGCFVRGVGCAVCGNPLGAIQTYCAPHSHSRRGGASPSRHRTRDGNASLVKRAADVEYRDSDCIISKCPIATALPDHPDADNQLSLLALGPGVHLLHPAHAHGPGPRSAAAGRTQARECPFRDHDEFRPAHDDVVRAPHDHNERGHTRAVSRRVLASDGGALPLTAAAATTRRRGSPTHALVLAPHDDELHTRFIVPRVRVVPRVLFDTDTDPAGGALPLAAAAARERHGGGGGIGARPAAGDGKASSAAPPDAAHAGECGGVFRRPGGTRWQHGRGRGRWWWWKRRIDLVVVSTHHRYA
ncbi:hypothetical protein C8R45DRAFT_464547 [Mycena sanguinolenta]|nr:hypothetical protein C8R45DRAFT_464547 [Mycena sanguinolenta]